MIFVSRSVILSSSLVAAVYSSPLNDFDLVARALSPAQCSNVVFVVSVLKVYQATSFCESFLSIKTSTSTFITSVEQLYNIPFRILTSAQHHHKDCDHNNRNCFVGQPRGLLFLAETKQHSALQSCSNLVNLP